MTDNTVTNVPILSDQLKTVRRILWSAEVGQMVLSLTASAAILDSCATELEKIAKSLHSIAGQRRELAGLDAMRAHGESSK